MHTHTHAHADEWHTIRCRERSDSLLTALEGSLKVQMQLPMGVAKRQSDAVFGLADRDRDGELGEADLKYFMKMTGNELPTVDAVSKDRLFEHYRSTDTGFEQLSRDLHAPWSRGETLGTISLGDVSDSTVSDSVLEWQEVELKPGDDLCSRSTHVERTSGSSPSNEGPENVVDGNVRTKYLNHSGAGAGVIMGPLGGEKGVVPCGLRLTSANDCSDRDPTSCLIEGSAGGEGEWKEIAKMEGIEFEERHQRKEFA
jgi:hypothetical protein